MQELTGGEAIVEALEAHGVDTVFGLPGAQVYGLFDALGRSGIRVIGARHEQACGYMAFGYARATGRPGVCAVVPGPGILNTGAALLTALGTNTPVLCLTGQVPTPFLDRGFGHLHEMPDQLATLRSFTKSAERMAHPGAAPDAIARAFQEMESGRPGPVALEMPWDVFTTRAPVTSAAPLPRRPDPVAADAAIEAAAELVRGARAPMIFVGGGAQEAGEEVRVLAERLGAPVAAFRGGRGVLPARHPLSIDIATAARLWEETDLVVGIGTRLEIPLWRWPKRTLMPPVLRIDIDPAEIARNPGDAPLLGRSGPTTAALSQALGNGAPSLGRGEAVAAARTTTAEAVQSVTPHVQYLEAIRDVLPDEAIVTDEMCQTGFTSWFAYPVQVPRTYLSTGYQGTLGAGFPSALGAKAAYPDRPVVAITGDGGFLFAVQELATAKQFGLAVVTLVFNNRGYGNVRRDQREKFDGRVVGSELENPDFVGMAASFGVAARQVTGPKQMREALDWAVNLNAPAVIAVDVDPATEASPWPFIQPGR